MKTDLKEVIELGERYLANDANGIECDGDNFMIIDGCVPVLLSAPHAVKQFRSGSEKVDDRSTGPIVEMVCKRSGAYGIIRTFNRMDDPNFDDSGYGLRYKDAIVELIKEKGIVCVIDVHACSDEHGFDVDIGTNDGENINCSAFLDIIKDEFEKIGTTEVNNLFKAARNTTVCNYVHRMSGVSCFQVEISARLRWKPESLLRVVDVMENVVKRISRVWNGIDRID